MKSKNILLSGILLAFLLAIVFPTPSWGFDKSTKLILPDTVNASTVRSTKLLPVDNASSTAKIGFSKKGRLILHLRSFEKAYDLLASEWIFIDSEKEIIKRAVDQIAADSSLPAPDLGDNDKENLALAKDYLAQAINNNYTDAEEIARNAIAAMFKPDRFSHILPDWQLKMFLFEPGDEYIGDGLVPDIDDTKMTVFITIPGTPAEQTDMLPGDVILKINDVSFENIADKEDMAQRLRQLNPDQLYKTVGARITYELLRDNGEIMEKVIVSTTVVKMGVPQDKQTVSAYRVGEIGVITIKEYNTGTGKLFVKKLTELMSAGIKGLIIDLRDNPGGFVRETIIIVKTLTGKGFTLTGKNSSEVADRKDLSGPIFSGPIAVLVNGHSASASEITAACLQESGAKLFGQTTYGKNCGQTITVLPNRNFLLYTNMLVATPGGKTWPNGVKPDVYTSSEEAYAKAKNFLEEKLKSK